MVNSSEYEQNKNTWIVVVKRECELLLEKKKEGKWGKNGRKNLLFSRLKFFILFSISLRNKILKFSFIYLEFSPMWLLSLSSGPPLCNIHPSPFTPLLSLLKLVLINSTTVSHFRSPKHRETPSEFRLGFWSSKSHTAKTQSKEVVPWTRDWSDAVRLEFGSIILSNFDLLLGKFRFSPFLFTSIHFQS